jgi:VanZ family protein
MVKTIEHEQRHRSASPRTRELLTAWGLVLLWMAAIFYVSAQNTWTVFEGPPIVRALRKGGHIFEYAVLAVLVGHALVTTWTLRGRAVTRALLVRAWWLGAILTTVYAITDELHQLFVPRRMGFGWDVVVDGLSATAALGIWYIVRVRMLRSAAPNRDQSPMGDTP